jgi:signal transduction histidine kinase
MSSQRGPSEPAAGAAAPISYPEIRKAARYTRAALGAALLVLAAIGIVSGIPGAILKAVAAALVVVHALVDLPAARPLPALVVDALLLCGAAGIGGRAHGPLVGATAYLVAVAVLLLPRRQVPVAAAAIGAGVALRLFAFAPASGEPAAASAAALAGAESAVYLVFLALMVLGAAHSLGRSRLRQAEALAAEQRAAQMKNEFVSMVSHELRTPLTNISGFAVALRESWRGFDPTEVDEFLDVVCHEADHLRALVDDVLVVPRLEADRLLIEPAYFPLRPAAFRIAGLVFPAGGDRSVSVSVGGSAIVWADPNRVEQVLRNLLENAARYGGSQVSVEAVLEGAEWVVTVADDGPGIAPEDRERIFAAFEQAGDNRNVGQGMGLGLTVCRVLVQAMGGRIWYEPGFPRGARFCFTLPAAESRREAAVPAAL